MGLPWGTTDYEIHLKVTIWSLYTAYDKSLDLKLESAFFEIWKLHLLHTPPPPLCAPSDVMRPPFWAPFRPPLWASYWHTSSGRRTSRQTTNSVWVLRGQWHQQIISQTKFNDVGVTGMTNHAMHVETNVTLITHYNVHSCQANVSVLACYWGNAKSVMLSINSATGITREKLTISLLHWLKS